jgi:putative ABC transport system substrate-binding protein
MPLAARAQQGQRVRRIGVLMTLAADDPEGLPRIKAFQEGLKDAGWVDGNNVKVDYRWSASDANLTRTHAAALLDLAPDVLVAHASDATAALQQATRTVPIVFVQGVDPVGAGFVESLPRPGGNITGFSSFEYQISGKWLELLKEIAPRIVRVGVVRDTITAAGAGQLGAIQAVASSFRVQLSPIGVSDAGAMERAIGAFAREPNSGLVVTTSTLASLHRNKIIAAADRHRLPAVYPYRYFTVNGGLLSYGIDILDLYRRTATYVDRILRGAMPADLPVQQPTTFELAVNLKTAKALGLTVPPTLLARADEVIE